MNAIHQAAGLWRRDFLVVAVETIERAGQRVPLAYSHLAVVDHQLTSSLFLPIAWGRDRPGGEGRPTDGALRAAPAGARTDRGLDARDLDDGAGPDSAVGFARDILRKAARSGVLVVTHDARLGLAALADAAAGRRAVRRPPLDVVDTAVLERARREGHRPRAGEPFGAFYRRVESLPGGRPDLLLCRQEQEWTDGIMLPEDRLFPAMTTYLIYLNHTGGRLLGSPGGSPGARRHPRR